MKLTTQLLAGAAALAAVAGSAVAQDDESYLSAGYSAFVFEDVTFHAAVARGGYSLSDSFSTEVEVLTSVVDSDADDVLIESGVDVSSLIAETRITFGVGLFGRYDFELTDGLSVFGRGGVGYLEAEIETGLSSDDLDAVSLSEKVSDADYYLSVGGGVEYWFSDRFALRGDLGYNKFSDDELVDSDFVSAGASIVGKF